MEPLTLFTWGYWGWGSATDKLIEAVDAVEVARGFKPPLFVDIRISRSVRAPGFNGSAFERQVGPERYRWMDSLGNVAVKEGGPMRIKAPDAANTLLDIAGTCARDRQRVLFFCSCEFPGVEDHERSCHRTKVAGLVLKVAKDRNWPVEVVEWPGGEPIEDLDVWIPAAEFHKLGSTTSSIPLADPLPLSTMAGMPWFSTVLVQRKEDEGLPEEELQDAPISRAVTGPARFGRGRWYLPVYELPEDGVAMADHVAMLRERGFEPRHS